MRSASPRSVYLIKLLRLPPAIPEDDRVNDFAAQKTYQTCRTASGARIAQIHQVHQTVTSWAMHKTSSDLISGFRV
jgi:hypothetical protein